MLRLVALGGSHKRIGITLYVTEDTVKAHMKAILTKLGASDRTHAVPLALRRGIIDLEVDVRATARRRVDCIWHRNHPSMHGSRSSSAGTR